MLHYQLNNRKNRPNLRIEIELLTPTKTTRRTTTATIQIIRSRFSTPNTMLSLAIARAAAQPSQSKPN
jgi:hypothetical protein